MVPSVPGGPRAAGRLPWLTAGIVAISAAELLVPGAASALEYARERVAEGEVWRVLSGQIVHYGWRMAFFDLSVILLIGSWIEMLSRRLVALTFAAGALLVGAGTHLLSSGVIRFRGASGIASALLVVALLVLSRPGGKRWERVAALLGLTLFLAKVIWESATGRALFAGHLPPRVGVLAAGHLLGAAAGAAAFALGRRWLRARRADNGEPGTG